MRSLLSSTVVGIGLLALAPECLADSRTVKYRSGGCDIERKYADDGTYEEKVECKSDKRRTQFRSGHEQRVGKEEFRRGGCEVKREWKEDGEYKEEVKCK
jgi:hypothetical protein